VFIKIEEWQFAYTYLNENIRKESDRLTPPTLYLIYFLIKNIISFPITIKHIYPTMDEIFMKGIKYQSSG